MYYVIAKRVVYTQGDVQKAETLLQEKPLQIGLNEPDVCVMKGVASVILDFGKELSGGARILSFFARGSKTVRLRFGESVGETCADVKPTEGLIKKTDLCGMWFRRIGSSVFPRIKI